MTQLQPGSPRGREKPSGVSLGAAAGEAAGTEIAGEPVRAATPPRAGRGDGPARLPIPLLLAAVLGLWAGGPATVYENPALIAFLNVFLTLPVSLLIAVLIARSFLAGRAPGLLLLGASVIVWAPAGAVGGALLVYGSNVGITVHNALVWLSALLHMAGAVVAWRGPRPVARPVVWLVGGYTVAGVAAACVVWLAMAGLLPTFFVQGQGGTPLRQAVLASAVAMFAVTAVFFWSAHRRRASRFAWWYSMALALTAIGLLAVALQSQAGSYLGWTGRVAQLVGGLYMLAAAVASVRECGAWRLSLDVAIWDRRLTAWDARLLRALTPMRLWSLPLPMRLGLALAILAVATGLRLALMGWMGTDAPYSISFAAVVVTTVLLGLGPGLLAAVLGPLAVEVFILDSLGTGLAGETPGLLIAAVVGVLLAWLLNAVRSADLEARSSGERLRLARQATRDVIWDWDVISDTQRWSSAGAEVFGWADAVETPQTASWWSDRVHPDDRPRVSEGFHAAVNDPARDHWQDEYRFLRRDGSIAHVLDRGYILRDGSGRARRMIGAMQDVTARRQTEAALRENQQRLQLALDAAYLISFEWDIQRNQVRRFVSTEPALAATMEDRPATFEDVQQVVHPEDREQFRRAVQAALASENGQYRNEFRIIRPGGEVVWLSEWGRVEQDA